MRFSTLLGYFINNEIIMMLIVGKNHRARFQISGGLLCSVVHRIVIDVFFQASYNAQGCQNFQKKNIYVKKNPRKKGVYLLTVFIFACHFALSLPFFRFCFCFFSYLQKKNGICIACTSITSQQEITNIHSFFYLKSSLGSLIGMCTNSRFFGRF